MDDDLAPIANTLAICVFLIVAVTLAVALWSRRKGRGWWAIDLVLAGIATVSAEVTVLIAYLQLTGDDTQNGWRDAAIAALVSITCITAIAKRPVRTPVAMEGSEHLGRG